MRKKILLVSLIFVLLFFLLTSLIKASYFFRFDPTEEIYMLKTEHFKVFFPKDYEKQAEKAAGIAEKKFKIMKNFLGWDPSKKIIIALYPNYDISNGFATVFPYGFIGLTLNPPSARSSINNYDEWLNLVITHELTHFFHLDQSRGLANFLRNIFGRAPFVFPHILNSTAWLEGIAVYSESKNTGFGRLNSSSYLAYIKNNAIFDNFPAYDRIYGGTNLFPGMGSPYIYGAYTIKNLNREQDWEKIKKSIEKASKIPMVYVPELSINSATDKMPWSHYSEMTEFYNQKYKGLKFNSKRITKNGFWKNFLVKENEYFYYIRNIPYEMSYVERYNLKDKKFEKILSRFEINSVTFSKNQNKLFFSAINRVKNYYYYSDIYYYDIKDKTIKKLSKSSRLSYPVYYKDNQLFAIKRDKDKSKIVIYDYIKKNQVKSLISFKQISSLSLDRENETIFFNAQNGKCWDIYSINLKSGDLTRITNNIEIEKYLKYKNNKLFFVSCSKKSQALYSYIPEDSSFVRFFESPTDIRGYSIDENKLYHLSIYKNGIELMVNNSIKKEKVDYNKSNENRKEKKQSISSKAGSYEQINVDKKKKANLLNFYKPTFWMPYAKEKDGRYLFGARTFAIGPYERNILDAELYYNPSAADYPSGKISFIHYFWYLPLHISYSDQSSKNNSLGDYRDIDFKAGTFYNFGDYYKKLYLSLYYNYESRGKTRYGYTLSGLEFNLNYDSTKSYPLSISRENGLIMSGGYRKDFEILGSDMDMDEYFGDFRLYLDGAFRNQVVALKLGYYESSGEGLKLVSVGGNDSYFYYPSVGDPSVSLQRGYESSSFYGNRIISFSLEVRNPLLVIERGFKYYPIFISQIYSSIFCDYSRVEWKDNLVENPLSFGIELNMDIVLNYAFKFTLTGGVAFPASEEDETKPRYYFRIGKSF